LKRKRKGRFQVFHSLCELLIF